MTTLRERAGVERPDPDAPPPGMKRPPLGERARGHGVSWIGDPPPPPPARPASAKLPPAPVARRPAPAPPSPPRRRVLVRELVRGAGGIVTAIIEREQMLPADAGQLIEAGQLVVQEVVTPILASVGDLLNAQDGRISELNRLLGAVVDGLRAPREAITVTVTQKVMEAITASVTGDVREEIAALARRIEALEAR